MEKNTIFNGDCLEIMSEIEDELVDMILCDLPYGVLNKSNPKAKWDSVIPFDALWKQYRRIIKPNGAIVLFGSGMFTANLMMSAGDLWKYNLIWEKGCPSGYLNANRMPLRKHEDIMVFYKKLPTYNPQFVYGKPHGIVGTMKVGTDCYGASKLNSKEYKRNVNYRHPVSILRFSSSRYRYHPSEKPIALCEYLIKTYSNEGDLILDNCCGSGTTCLAAKNTGRKFIGIEKDQEYFEIAKRRMEENF